jgi:lipid-binding SYLF domain-containing protein
MAKLKIGMIVALVTLFTCAAWARTNYTSADTQETNKAAQTLKEMTASNQVPKPLLDQAQCIGVIPGMTKAGFIVGGEHGTGVLSCRTDSGWSAPAFFSISGGSVGLQAGAASSQIVLLMNQQGKQNVLNGNFKLSANAVAAGPSGKSYNASAAWNAPILSYSKSHGAYAGVNIQGSTIQLDNGRIHTAYGANVTAQQVLNGSIQAPLQAQQFESALPHA